RRYRFCAKSQEARRPGLIRERRLLAREGMRECRQGLSCSAPWRTEIPFQRRRRSADRATPGLKYGRRSLGLFPFFELRVPFVRCSCNLEVVTDTRMTANPPHVARWWWQLNSYHWFVLIVASLGWLFDCLDQQLFTLSRMPAMRALVPEGNPLK